MTQAFKVPTMTMLSTRFLPALVIAAVFSTTPARADVVDRALVRNAPDIARAVRALKADYVAVLKFAVKVGDRPATFDAGLANTQLAHKLENLLVLTYDPDHPVIVLTGAAGKAAALPAGTTWRDADGRKRLATLAGLPMAWDDKQSLAPDAFVTGELHVAADLQSA